MSAILKQIKIIKRDKTKSKVFVNVAKLESHIDGFFVRDKTAKARPISKRERPNAKVLGQTPTQYLN